MCVREEFIFRALVHEFVEAWKIHNLMAGRLSEELQLDSRDGQSAAWALSYSGKAGLHSRNSANWMRFIHVTRVMSLLQSTDLSVHHLYRNI